MKNFHGGFGGLVPREEEKNTSM